MSRRLGHMKPELNPFAPGSGSRPPALAGRDDILDSAKVGITRMATGLSSKGLLLVGLRGVGKTVLLNAIQSEVERRGFYTASCECAEGQHLAELLIPQLRGALIKLSSTAATKEVAQRAIRTLHSFVSQIKISYKDIKLSFDGPKQPGSADSGDLSSDLTDLFVCIGEATQETKTALSICVDEMQYLDEESLRAILMALHKINQRRLPVYFVGAGLPPLIGKMGNSRSYSERLFSVPEMGPLTKQRVQHALVTPVEKAKAYIELRAVEHIFKVTEGYAYFVQEWGQHAWNSAKGANIDLRAAQHADLLARDSLDREFFSFQIQ
jgi:AAA ATPase-like protein